MFTELWDLLRHGPFDVKLPGLTEACLVHRTH